MPIAPYTKYLCVYLTKNGFEVEVGCEHYTPERGIRLDYVFGGSVCFNDWIKKFQDGLRLCNHAKDETETLGDA